MRSREIKVCAVCPGPVETEFFTMAEEGQGVMWYKTYSMASSPQVVKKALRDAVNDKELSIYGAAMNLFFIMSKIVPHKVILDIIGLMNREN